MIISKKWLSAYIDLPGDESDLDVALTNVGLEVEGIEHTGGVYSDVVVGHVLDCMKHPDAKKLSVCTVFDGAENHTVVCGAPNVAAGQKVAFARVGAELPKIGLTVGRRAIRGVESAGMLCSEAELGISQEASGIIVLPEDAPAGRDLHELFTATDEIIHIGITPNRGDALSHVGVARDLAALFGRTLRLPEVPEFDSAGLAPVNVTIEVPDMCPRYSAAVMDSIVIGPSPDWLRRSLEAVGLRSINNVVDVTNFVMLEIGQPMHAFDLALLAGPRIIVRPSTEGEAVTTLDGQNRALPASTLLICDAEKPVAVAGVMGAGNSEIRETTQTILLESAYFDPSTVRRASKLLGLTSESSYRFERGIDPETTVWALRRAVALLTGIAGGRLVGFTDRYSRRIERPRILLRPDRVTEILGLEIPVGRQMEILAGLEFACERTDDGILCTPPSCRSDIDREIDIIEELARINGYDRIPLERGSYTSDFFEDEEVHVSDIRHHCLALGYDEIISSSLVAADVSESFATETARVVKVLNPVSKERPALRSSLVPGLLETVDRNLRNGIETIRIFEIGSIYHARNGEGGDTYHEALQLGLAVAGFAQSREWYAGARRFDFFDVKGTLAALFERLGIADLVQWEEMRGSGSEHERLAIVLDGRRIGSVEETHPMHRKMFGIEEAVFVAIVDVAELKSAMYRPRSYKPIGKYPVVKRDIAMVFDEAIPVGGITRTLHAAGIPFFKNLKVVDVFSGEQTGKGKKSVALALTFQSAERTLTELEINSSVEQAVKALEHAFDAVLRA